MNTRALAASSGGFHAVKFYEDADSLCRLVAEFLGEGFVIGQPAIVIARPAHRAGIERELHARGFDVERQQANVGLLFVDAEQAVAGIMVEGMPGPREFGQTILPLIKQASRQQKDCVVRAYGEMVDVLWQAGQTAAAMRLEMLWNKLAETHRFSLLCGYSMGHFYKNAAVGNICGQHTHVLSEMTDIASVQ